MRKRTLHVAATALIVAGLAALVIGFQGTEWLWQAGLALVATAMALSVAGRWAQDEKEEQPDADT